MRSEGEEEMAVTSERGDRDRNGQFRGDNAQMTMVESNVHHNHYHERNDGEEIHL